MVNEAKLAAEQKEANMAKARADEEKRKRLEAERQAEKTERKHKRKVWWKRNRKRFAMAVGSVILIIVIINIYNSCQNKHRQQQAYEDSVRQDSIKAAERQQHFDEVAAEFKNLLDKPLDVDNAYQTVVDSRRVLQQMLQLLSETPTLYKDSPQNLIDRYNTLVDNAIKIFNDAIDDPNSAPQREELKRELNPKKDCVQRLHY